MKFGFQENIALPLLFIDGITRCGKSMFSGVVPSLQRMEHIQIYTELEMIISGLSLGGLSPEYAKAFLRIYFNERSYNLQLSRNVNFRPDDQTGVGNYPEPDVYHNRLNVHEGDEAVEKSRRGKNYIPIQTHDLMVNLDHLNKMDLNYKMLSLWRHPVDNIYSWWTRGWGERYNNDPRGFTILVSGGSELFPWYAVGMEDELAALNPMEKCVRIATDLLARAIDQFGRNQENSRIHLLTFEDFCEQTDSELARICTFLGTAPSAHTARYLVAARSPRTLDPAERQAKRDKFKQGMRPEIYDLLLNYSARYEKNVYGLKAN